MLPIAKILKSNGIDGDVLIGLLGIDAEEIETTEPVFVEFDGLPVPFFIERITPKGSTRAIVHLTDVDNLQDAEEMVGREILLDAEDEEDDFEDFTGWTVYDGGRLVGTATGLEDIPGNPCLCVAPASGSGEVLIPLHEDFIISADPSSRTLTMSLPEGLL
jgi:16S rRNA processing protein RimM